LVTAYHEGGHALVAAALPGTDPVQKVTILPRGRALGYTMVLPEQDKYANTRSELLDQLAYMMGGRAAEELVFHDPTTGASNDIEKASAVARAMVTQYGMTERLGAIKLGSGDAEPFLGRDIGHGRDYSEEVAAIVDEEVSKLISNAHQEAFDILNENRDVLDDLVRALFEKETLDRQEVAAVFQPLRLWPKRPAWTGSDERVPSAIPPVTPPPPPAIPINGQNGPNGKTAGGAAPGPEDQVPAGGAPQPPGHFPVPSQLPTAGESEPPPHRGPDFR
jgi:cell division protease FtsH